MTDHAPIVSTQYLWFNLHRDETYMYTYSPTPLNIRPGPLKNFKQWPRWLMQSQLIGPTNSVIPVIRIYRFDKRSNSYCYGWLYC